CLNVGCIPSKALLDSSELYWVARRGMGVHGVRASGVELDLPAMMARKDKVVRGLTQGVAGLFKKNGVEWIRGAARLAGGTRVAARHGPRHDLPAPAHARAAGARVPARDRGDAGGAHGERRPGDARDEGPERSGGFRRRAGRDRSTAVSRRPRGAGGWYRARR